METPAQIKLDRFRLVEVAPDFYEIQDRQSLKPYMEVKPDGYGMPPARLEEARKITQLLNEVYERTCEICNCH